MKHTVRNTQLIEDLKREFMTRLLARQAARAAHRPQPALLFRIANMLRVPSSHYTYTAAMSGVR